MKPTLILKSAILNIIAIIGYFQMIQLLLFPLLINMKSGQGFTSYKHKNKRISLGDPTLQEPIGTIKAKIGIITDNTQEKVNRNNEKHRENVRRLRDEEMSLSISNNASALFSIGDLQKYEEEALGYEKIANLTQEENHNLKQQNNFLADKLAKMKHKAGKYSKILSKAKQYKNLYLESLNELMMVREECKAYKHKAEEMKIIAMRDVNRLEEKLMPVLGTADDSESVKSYALSTPNMEDEQKVGSISYANST